jgi:hypothetical protein
VFPVAPDMVCGLVACFLLQVKDDLTVCSTCMTQDRGEMSKLGGSVKGVRHESAG